ncbi:MAG: class I SAM-dependent methyltransferase [Steroidobacteraceae bacterium]
MKPIMLAIGLVGAALLCVASQARGVLPDHAVTRAVADRARPEADRARDAERKPAESLAFAGVHPGEHLVELLPGGGYFTRLFSLVVGPRGLVLGLGGRRRARGAPPPPARAAPIPARAPDPHYGNVLVRTMSIKELVLPEAVDLVWTSQNYHDLHNIPNAIVADFDKLVFNALKPGGVFIVLDHAAAAASGFRDTSSLHRIDPEAVKNEVESAGFRFEGASAVLHNAADDHTLNVFDPAIRGKTDQFILKFRKPR